MVAALFRTTSSAIDAAPFVDVVENALSGFIQVEFFAQHGGFVQLGAAVLFPPAGAGSKNLVLHDGTGGTKIQQIHRAMDKVCDLPGLLPKRFRLCVAGQQDGQIQVATVVAAPANAAAKGIHGHKFGPVLAQQVDDGLVVHGAVFQMAAVREPLNNSLRTQRDLERAAVVSCLDGQGGSLSERQGAAVGGPGRALVLVRVFMPERVLSGLSG